jgi:hypothetical protein
MRFEYVRSVPRQLEHEREIPSLVDIRNGSIHDCDIIESEYETMLHSDIKRRSRKEPTMKSQRRPPSRDERSYEVNSQNMTFTAENGHIDLPKPEIINTAIAPRQMTSSAFFISSPEIAGGI